MFIILNKSLQTSVFSDNWKQSYVVPIFKSGQRDNVANYRSVCTQSDIPKLFDCLVGRQLTSLCGGLYPKEQQGSTKNRRRVSNLAVYETDILKSTEQCKQVDAIYTDFSKGFDRVDH